MLTWFQRQPDNVKKQVIALGKQALEGNSLDRLRQSFESLTESHEHLVRQIEVLKPVKHDQNRKPAQTQIEWLITQLHKQVRSGIIVGTPIQNIIPFTLKSVPGVIYNHSDGVFVSQEHINAYLRTIQLRIESSHPIQVALFVSMHDTNIPGCSSVFHSQLSHSTTGKFCYVMFVTGVQEYPDRLSIALQCACTLAQLGDTTIPQKTSKQLAYLVDSLKSTINAAKSAVTKQSEIQNFVTGVSDTSQSIIFELNKHIRSSEMFLNRYRLHTGSTQKLSATTATVEQHVAEIRRKLHAAWNEMVQRGERLTRKQTVAAVMRLFPGQIQGFKNDNCLANTLRYYNTNFSKEKEAFLKHE